MSITAEKLLKAREILMNQELPPISPEAQVFIGHQLKVYWGKKFFPHLTPQYQYLAVAAMLSN